MRRFKQTLVFSVLVALVVCGCASEEEKKRSHFEKGKAYFEKGEYKSARIEFKNAAFGLNLPVMNFIGGLGGRDVSLNDVRFMFERLLVSAKTGKVRRDVTWMGTRGVEQ